MGALLFRSSKRDEQNKERKMDENNVNGFNDMDDDEDEDDDSFDDDKLTEESYRTTYETDPEDLINEAEDISDDEY